MGLDKESSIASDTSISEVNSADLKVTMVPDTPDSQSTDSSILKWVLTLITNGFKHYTKLKKLMILRSFKMTVQ